MRKTHLITRALGLVEGIVQPSDSPGSYNNARKDSSNAHKEAPSSQFAMPSRGVQELKSYPTQHAEYFRVPVMPRNPFRDDMSLQSRTKSARCCKAASRSGVVTNFNGISAIQSSLDLVEARAAASKNSRSRYAARWHEIAMLHRVLETGSNRRPARNTLDILHRVMRGRTSVKANLVVEALMQEVNFIHFFITAEAQTHCSSVFCVAWSKPETACENPTPGCLTRDQFVSTLSGTLDPCDRAGLQRLYSSFDPDGTHKLRFVELLACLVVTHKPETEALLEGLQQTFLRNLG